MVEKNIFNYYVSLHSGTLFQSIRPLSLSLYIYIYIYTEHSFLIELRNMCDTCVTHVRHMCDSCFFWIAFRISFLIKCVSAIYQNGVEVQKRQIFHFFQKKFITWLQ